MSTSVYDSYTDEDATRVVSSYDIAEDILVMSLDSLESPGEMAVESADGAMKSILTEADLTDVK